MRPLNPDSEHTHPSIGERRYLGFTVSIGEDVMGDPITIQGVPTADDATNRFTDDAVLDQRTERGS